MIALAPFQWLHELQFFVRSVSLQWHTAALQEAFLLIFFHHGEHHCMPQDWICDVVAGHAVELQAEDCKGAWTDRDTEASLQYKTSGSASGSGKSDSVDAEGSLCAEHPVIPYRSETMQQVHMIPRVGGSRRACALILSRTYSEDEYVSKARACNSSAVPLFYGSRENPSDRRSFNLCPPC
jgi:hypothetical protein